MGLTGAPAGQEELEHAARLAFWRFRQKDLEASIPRRLAEGSLRDYDLTAALDALTGVRGLVAGLERRS